MAPPLIWLRHHTLASIIPRVSAIEGFLALSHCLQCQGCLEKGWQPRASFFISFTTLLCWRLSFLLSCFLLPTPNSTWVPRLVLGLGSGSQVHFLPISSNIVDYDTSVRGKSWVFPVHLLHPIWSTHCCQAGDLASMELPDEGENNIRRASGVAGLCQLPTSHKQIKREYWVTVFFFFIWVLFTPTALGAALADWERSTPITTWQEDWRLSTSSLELTV